MSAFRYTCCFTASYNTNQNRPRYFFDVFLVYFTSVAMVNNGIIVITLIIFDTLKHLLLLRYDVSFFQGKWDQLLG